MSEQQIPIKHIGQESVLAAIIAERDSIILMLAEQLKVLQQENEKLKTELEKLNKKAKEE